MLELLLVSFGAAFLLAVAEPALNFIEIFIKSWTTNTVSSILASGLTTWLAGMDQDIRTFVLYTMAGAFVSKSMLALVERAVTYRPVITRQN
jgi:hypothetical protein